MGSSGSDEGWPPTTEGVSHLPRGHRVGAKGSRMASGPSCAGWFIINTCISNVVFLCPLPSQAMRPCSVLVGRFPCPCDGLQTGSNENVCDACLHAPFQHIPSATLPTPLESPVARSAPVRARAVTALFKSILDSTPGGSLAKRETSNGLRKSKANTNTVGHPAVTR